MSESPRRGARSVPAVVPPQPVCDRSVLDSVAGFINDVTLTSSGSPGDGGKDSILWARFETDADVSDLKFGEDWDVEAECAPPLLLTLGYGSGVQMWAIPATGEAVEVLSWRHGSVKCLRVLPTPIPDDSDMADVPCDQFASKRPIMALCDSPQAPTGGGTAYCSVTFVSLADGDVVKSIKFKNPIVDILANRSTIVVTFQERIAVFDARNFEDRCTVTTCHPSPGLNPNPVALGSRWMAYAERRLMSKRSSGGCDCDGVASYTATMLNAAKSLGKGLRELGESVAAGFTSQAQPQAGSPGSGSSTPVSDPRQPGVVTIMDIKHPIKDISPTTGAPISASGIDPIVAHFVAHSDAIVALQFDPSGMLLLTADRRGHDFHVFRIHPHPSGASHAAVHHLYVLHRGDTTAKVQDIVFSLDSRWVAVSSLRGTTHVFPVTPYGGPAGIRTHGSPHVVNRLSRFHRSAGLSMDGARSSSPVSYTDTPHGNNHTGSAYTNPRLPPFPHPTVILPLTQLRQPTTLVSVAGSGPATYPKGRQRHSSLSDDPNSMKPLRMCATFARPRAWLLDPPGSAREAPSIRMQRRAVDSLFIMAGHGALIQYDLEPKHTTSVAKERVSDDTPIELDVEAKAQWNLLRTADSLTEIQPPLPSDNWLLRDRVFETENAEDVREGERDDRWLAQVEIITHAGPHRRLWMGPQFIFKTYNTPSGSSLSHIDAESVEVGIATASGPLPARSNPMNMPITTTGRPIVPVLIESGSYSSYEPSPRLTDQFRHDDMDPDFSLGPRESQLREDLADAMRESPNVSRDATGPPSSCAAVSVRRDMSTMAVGHLTPPPSGGTSRSVAKVVNPLGTVTTVTQSVATSCEMDTCLADHYLHENCDEALFRPVITVISDVRMAPSEEVVSHDVPEPVGMELIVPVVEEHQVPQKIPEPQVTERVADLAVGKKSNGRKKKEPSPPPEVPVVEPEEPPRLPKPRKKSQLGVEKPRKARKGGKNAEIPPEEEPSRPNEEIESKIDEILLAELQPPEDEPDLPHYRALKEDFQMIQDSLLKDSIVMTTTATTSKPDDQFPEIVNDFFDVTTTKLDLEFPDVEPLAPLEPFELKFEPMYGYEKEEPPPMFDSRRRSDSREKKQFWSDYCYDSYEEKMPENNPTERILSVSGSSENDSESSSGPEKASEGSDGHDEELQPLINASGGASEGSPLSDRYAAEQKSDKECAKVSETLPAANQSDSKQQKKKSRRKKR
ncbi:breast carcinoma-amplified sequence 3 homolog [Lutzomyia longipalpis]|uniref:breast carcinoma-amplified sequence 3 homolog n=1 Tax=Lutzomyia longipalpis TaxID=7200 RepID=UPI002483C0B5|nr:breast carcinoma-amplified sequence 3 homolog [Lutzomyia longipalpis]